MSIIYLGIDISKGYGDFAFVNESGSVLCHIRADDDFEGHSKLVGAILKTKEEKRVERFVVGVEASGGLERNWVGFFRELACNINLEINRLNPLIVKMFLQRELHRNVTDKSSAVGIAHYLRKGLASAVCFESELEGLRTLYRTVRKYIERTSEMKNELQSLLPVVHPELVRYCRYGIANWVLSLLEEYPTAAALGQAEASALLGINFMSYGRAEEIIKAAESSVASQVDEDTGDTVSMLAGEILRCDALVRKYKRKICERLSNEKGVKNLISIPGIGIWSASCLRLEIGNIERFHSPEALVAYAGLDPRTRQSGDSIVNCGISRRGRKQIRQILYPVVLASLRCNPVISAFYSRLRGRGKKHLVAAVACMNKILHIAYGCWISDQIFDEKRHFEVYQRYNEEKIRRLSQRSAMRSNLSISAPVSKREARKRRAAAKPQCGQAAKVRGQGAAETTLYNNGGR